MTATLPGLDPTALHPAWCMSGFCDTTGPAPLHVSAPIMWRMQGSDVDVTLQRRQEGLVGEALISVHLANEVDPEESTLLFFTERDVDRLFTGISELRGCG